MDLAAEKLKFLAHYNPSADRDLALTSGIKAAAQHNALYARTTSPELRNEIRSDWKSALVALSDKYQAAVDDAVYETDLEWLVAFINDRHGRYLREESELPPGCAKGFRISHAQKSLSVYLKHLWCMDEASEPPQCPVDRYVLRKLGMSGTWTRIGTIVEHRQIVDVMRSKVGELPLAQWELLAFLD
ncbi:MAG TPA: hypothetical protein DCP20_01305 [Coriobacteriia bacterium]|nr:hypothetical protein [Coriobacteriia bacterium]